MRLPIQSIFKGLLLLLSAVVATYALGHYWITAGESDYSSVKFRNLNGLFVYSHFVGGAIALLSGAIQLFITKGSSWHRQLGMVYCLTVIVAGIGGGYLSFFANQGPFTGISFFILDVLWLYATLRAVFYARNHQVDKHRRWVVRSFALTAAAISLRLQLLLLTQVWSFDTSYLIVAWSCWIGNLLLAECYLLFTSPKIQLSRGKSSL